MLLPALLRRISLGLDPSEARWRSLLEAQGFGGDHTRKFCRLRPDDAGKRGEGVTTWLRFKTRGQAFLRTESRTCSDVSCAEGKSGAFHGSFVHRAGPL